MKRQPSIHDVTETEPERETVARREQRLPRLKLLYSAEEGVCDRQVDVGATGVTIGRTVSADKGLSVPTDARASRTHAEITLEGDSWILADRQSRNGTFLNRNPVQRARLLGGDVIRIGGSLLLFCIEPSEPADNVDLGPGLSDRLLGSSLAIRRLRAQLARIARRRDPVLLQGETGTGKDVAATVLHALSGLPGRLVPCNLGGLTSSLAESTFFGHEKNAFTGAQRQLGLFREAHRGTLFLDEIGELPIALQPLLLRALEEGVVRPIGGQPEPVSVRIVAATNRNLQALSSDSFRADLRARLSALPLALPPLRERREDILFLLQHFLGRRLQLPLRQAEALLCYAWPENVRQVANLARQLNAFAEHADGLDLSLLPQPLPGLPQADLPAEMPEERVAPPSFPPSAGLTPAQPRGPLQKRLQLELTPASAAELWRTHKNVASIARFVGMSRRQLTRWLDAWKIRDESSQ